MEEDAETLKHKSAIDASTSSAKIQQFFKNTISSKDQLKTVAKEETWAYHTARHNISFKSNDCSGTLIKNMFDGKFSLARTKVAAIVNNVIHPMIDEMSSLEFERMNFVSIITETSKRLNVKMLPIVARGFNPETGVLNMLVNLVAIPNEKLETIVIEIMKMFVTKNFTNKIIGYGADNTRRGQENVWRKLQSHLQRRILGIGAHITNNAAKHGCQMLKFNFEALVVNINSYFKIHAVRTEALRSVCEELELMFMPIKSHSGTRFLSLNPALSRIIVMFQPLSEYFLSIAQCPPSIRCFFESPSSKFWLVFVECQTKSFNITIESESNRN